MFGEFSVDVSGYERYVGDYGLHGHAPPDQPVKLQYVLETLLTNTVHTKSQIGRFELLVSLKTRYSDRY